MGHFIVAILALAFFLYLLSFIWKSYKEILAAVTSRMQEPLKQPDRTIVENAKEQTHQNNHLNKIINDQVKRMDEMQRKSEEEIGNIKDLFQDMMLQITDVRKNAENRFEELQGDLTQSRDLKEQIRDAKLQMDEFRTKDTDRNEQIADLYCRTVNLDQHLSKINDLREQIDHSSHRVNEFQTRDDEKSQRIADLQNQIGDLHRDLARIQVPTETCEVQKAGTTDESQQHVSDMQEQINQLQAKIDVLQLAMDGSKGLKEQIKAIRTRSHQNGNLQQQIDELRNRLAETVESDELSEKIRGLKLEICSAQKKNANHQLLQTTQFQADYRRSQQEIYVLEAKMKKMAHDIQKLKEEGGMSWSGVVWRLLLAILVGGLIVVCVHVEVKGSTVIRNLQDSVRTTQKAVKQLDARILDADEKWSRIQHNNDDILGTYQDFGAETARKMSQLSSDLIDVSENLATLIKQNEETERERLNVITELNDVARKVTLLIDNKEDADELLAKIGSFYTDVSLNAEGKVEKLSHRLEEVTHMISSCIMREEAAEERMGTMSGELRDLADYVAILMKQEEEMKDDFSEVNVELSDVSRIVADLLMHKLDHEDKMKAIERKLTSQFEDELDVLHKTVRMLRNQAGAKNEAPFYEKYAGYSEDKARHRYFS